jgi:adenosylcobinamide kinase/adenosylcobinamide-phosphate guanylyltransferase
MHGPVGRTTLITGGVRSGRSSFGQELARSARRPVAVVATAQPLDADFERRIERHRRERPAPWTTVEEPLDLIGAVQRSWPTTPVVLVDDLTLWTSNRLLAAAPDPKQADWLELVEQTERTLLEEVGRLAAQVPLESWLILVSQETGWGIHPVTPLGRAYRDLLGLVNQEAARAAAEVYLLVAGLPIEVKRLAMRRPPS